MQSADRSLEIRKVEPQRLKITIQGWRFSLVSIGWLYLLYEWPVKALLIFTILFEHMIFNIDFQAYPIAFH